MYNVPVPSFASHCRNSFATNSGPLSERIFSGVPRPELRSLRTSPVFSPRGSPDSPACIHRSASTCEWFFRRGSFRSRNRSPNVIRTFRPQPHARAVVQPQTPARPLFLLHFQSRAPPDALHAILAHRPTRRYLLRRYSPVPVTPILLARAMIACVNASSSVRCAG